MKQSTFPHWYHECSREYLLKQVMLVEHGSLEVISQPFQGSICDRSTATTKMFVEKMTTCALDKTSQQKAGQFTI